MKRCTIWDTTTCSPLKINPRFGGTCYLHFQGRSIRQERNRHVADCKQYLMNEILICYRRRQISWLYHSFKWSFSYIYIMWRICSLQELLSHRDLRARAQRESCGLYRRVARRQLRLHNRKCEWRHIPHSTRNYATLGKHPSRYAVTSCNRVVCAATVVKQSVNTAITQQGSEVSIPPSGWGFIRETGMPKEGSWSLAVAEFSCSEWILNVKKTL
jgi:hypothetical protein